LNIRRQIWDSSTGRLLEILRGHRQKIFRLAFGSDGNLLLAE
jgi:WD40 repeat protein